MTKWDFITLLVAAGAGVMFSVGLLVPESFTGDTSYYLGLADNLRHGFGYTFNARFHTRFPPLVPLILAGLRQVFGTNWHLMLQAMAVGGFLALISVWAAFRQVTTPLRTGVIVIIFATTGYFFHLVTTDIRSEIPFSIFLYLALREAFLPQRSGVLRAANLALLSSAAVLTRSVGIALSVALLASALSRQNRTRTQRAALCIGGAISLFVFFAWNSWTNAHRTMLWDGEFMDTYLAQIQLLDPHQPGLGQANVQELLLRGIANTIIQATHVAELLTRIDWLAPLWFSPLVLFLLLFTIIGLCEVLFSKYDLMGYFFGGYVAIYILWPWDESMRFFLPVFPISVFLAWLGLEQCLSFARTHRPAVSIILFCAALGFGAAAIVSPAGQGSIQVRLSALLWAAVLILSLTALFPKFWLKLCDWATAYLLPVFFVGIVCGGTYDIAKETSINWHSSERDLRHYPSVVAARALENLAPPDAVVMAQEDAILHFVSKHRTLNFPPTLDTRLLTDIFRRYEVEFLVVIRNQSDPYFFPTEDERLIALQNATPAVLGDLVFRDGDTEIYRVETN